MSRPRTALLAALLALGLIAAAPGAGPRPSPPAGPNARMNGGLAVAPAELTAGPAAPSAITAPAPAAPADWLPGADDLKGMRNLALITLGSLLPVVVLMFTPFVRIHITLVLLRQAMGSPQVPGNQVLAALALLLTLLVMRPVGESVYKGAVAPYAARQIDGKTAWEIGSRPVKNFLVNQIVRTGHLDYLYKLYDYAEPDHVHRPDPESNDDFPLHVVAPAYLLSELTTALWIGFMIYLPFLVVDLVVAAVLSAMGLFMLPPTLVAMPLKLILFVLADGWLRVATSLLQTFRV